MLRGEIRIHKSPNGGVLGQWLLDGVKVVANGSTVFDKQGLDRWLSNGPGGTLDWHDTI
jgi:hypothetical protein